MTFSDFFLYTPYRWFTIDKMQKKLLCAKDSRMRSWLRWVTQKRQKNSCWISYPLTVQVTPTRFSGFQSYCSLIWRLSFESTLTVSIVVSASPFQNACAFLWCLESSGLLWLWWSLPCFDCVFLGDLAVEYSDTTEMSGHPSNCWTTLLMRSKKSRFCGGFQKECCHPRRGSGSHVVLVS